MGVLSTISKVLRASSQSTHRGGGAGEAPTGAYWCDDCGERVSDAEGEAAPDCPDCGESMTFERSPGTTGCAC
ncbi:hypothetical protein [Haloarcula onubensis]|uniref:RING-type E3 ubiquitin transferase n=1 Tax=Haloarcula onubensis TaxID=2950539 RepID=A0ABU2FLD3_9EURY|nr:hypothetical protein [Halomicroarcula sp. S3CR25-11]MDS0281117.1 hypothetical protein [Halomicroarcula sp. S3CR25-11]